MYGTRVRSRFGAERDSGAEQGIEDESGDPGETLRAEREARFDQRRIEQEREERSGVGEREETPGNAAGFLAGHPDLQERAGGGKQEERKSDGEREGAEDGGDRVCLGTAQIGLRESEEQNQGDCEQGHVEECGPAACQGADERVGVRIAEEQDDLEKHEAGNPDSRRAAQRRKQPFSSHRLHSEEEKGAKEDGGSVEDAHAARNGHAKEKSSG